MPRAWARCIPPSLIPRWDRSLTAPFARSHRRTSPDLLLRCITSTSGLMGTSPLRNFFWLRSRLFARNCLGRSLFRNLVPLCRTTFGRSIASTVASAAGASHDSGPNLVRVSDVRRRAETIRYAHHAVCPLTSTRIIDADRHQILPLSLCTNGGAARARGLTPLSCSRLPAKRATLWCILEKKEDLGRRS
jgi:hypothetical protein